MAVDKFIKKVQVGTSTVNDLYDIAALYIREVTNNTEVLHTWQDIENLITVGFTIVVGWSKTNYESATAPQDLSSVPAVTVYYNNGTQHTTGGLPAYLPSTRQHIYLIYRGSSVAGSDFYDEYVATGAVSTIDPDTGDPVIPEEGTYSWERIGSTNIDLSQYALKTQAAAAGTYTTDGPSTDSTGQGGAGTFTTSSAGGQTGTGTATITYVGAPTVTGEAGSGAANANTGSAGGVTVQGSSFTFTGSATTVTIPASLAEIQIDNHEYQPAGSISGTQVVNNHTHNVNLSTASATVVTSVDLETGSAGDHTHTVDTHSHGTAVTVVTGIATNTISAFYDGGSASLTTKNYGFSSSQADIMYSPQVNSGVLSWSLATAGTQDALTFTPATGTSTVVAIGASGTATAAGAVSAVTATLTTSSAGAHTHSVGSSANTITYVTGATLDPNGGLTIQGSNFSFTGATATLYHTQVATETINYETLNATVPTITAPVTALGTIGGSFVIADHNHTYTAPAAHTHSITGVTTTITVPLEVALSDHTHTVTLSSHTHSLSNHTHNVAVSAIATPTV